MKLVFWLSVLALLLVGAAWFFLDREAPNRAGGAKQVVEARSGRPTPERLEPLVRVEFESLERALVSVLRTENDSGSAARDAGVRGTVLGSSGGERRPLTGVEVVAYDWRRGEDNRYETETSEDGAYSIAGMHTGSYELTFRHAEWTVSRVDGVRVVARNRTRVDVTLEGGFAVAFDVGQVTGDRARLPVAGAEVIVLPGSMMEVGKADAEQARLSGREALTDGAGRATVPALRAGLHTVVVRSDALVTWMEEVRLSPGMGDVRVDLKPGGSIVGSVLTSSGTAPGRAWVFLCPETYPIDTIRRYHYAREVVRTDAGGSFRFDGVRPGEHFVVAILEEGEVAFERDPVDVSEGEELRVELRGTEGATLEGRVASADGRPLANAEVYVSRVADLHPKAQPMTSLANESIDGLQRSTRTAQDGTFRLEGVRTATGSVKLVASLEGHESARENVGVEPGGQVFVELELQALDGVVAGEVRLGDGTPVQDVAVGAKAESLFGRSDVWVEQTDADGRFAIHVPAARGTFRVYTMLDRRQKDTWTATPEAYEDVAPESEDVVFTLALREQITGWVVDEQERPVRDFELQLFNDVLGRYRFARFVESEDGSFVMPFDAEEDLFLKVVAAGHEPFEIWDLERQADVKLIVRLRSQLLELAGRVLDAEGRPVPGARVMRSNYDRDAAFPPGSRYSPVSVTDAEGRFLLNGIAAANEATLLVSGPQPSSPPLVRFALAGAERAGDEVVLRLPQVAPTVLHLRSAGGGAPRGLYTITSEDGFPLDPRLEQVLEHEAGDALPALDELGPGGELRIVLPAGPHRFVYRATGAGMDDIQVYEFVVSLSEPNEFTFLLVGS